MRVWETLKQRIPVRLFPRPPSTQRIFKGYFCLVVSFVFCKVIFRDPPKRPFKTNIKLTFPRLFLPRPVVFALQGKRYRINPKRFSGYSNLNTSPLSGPYPQYGWDFPEEIPERPRKRSQSVSWNFPREYGWDAPNPMIQGIWGFQSVSRILCPPVRLGTPLFSELVPERASQSWSWNSQQYWGYFWLRDMPS